MNVKKKSEIRRKEKRKKGIMYEGCLRDVAVCMCAMCMKMAMFSKSIIISQKPMKRKQIRCKFKRFNMNADLHAFDFFSSKL